MPATTALPYREPSFTASDISIIDGLNRSTLLGWIKRYGGCLSRIGIEPVEKGATRRFTLEQVGILALLKSATRIQQVDAILEEIDVIVTHAEEVYEEISKEIRMEMWGQNPDDKRPYFPPKENPSHLEGRLYLEDQAGFYITDRPYASQGEDLLDLSRFPLPVFLIPLDATLRNAWQRATLYSRGYSV